MGSFRIRLSSTTQKFVLCGKLRMLSLFSSFPASIVTKHVVALYFQVKIHTAGQTERSPRRAPPTLPPFLQPAMPTIAHARNKRSIHVY